MSETLTWWLMAQVVGLAALPICLTLFRSLPDRGYSLSKPFALILLGYIFWILVIIGLPNSTRAIVFVLALLVAASASLLWGRREELVSFVRSRWWLIAATEAVFFLAFVIGAYLHSFVPEIGGTEKPMDFMFLNAVTVSDTFPPEDAWLSGESVSYYYFGYLLISIMTRLSGLATSVGFNLGLAFIAAMAITAAFGIVYNLTSPREEQRLAEGPGTPAGGFASKPLWRPMAFGVVAALLLTVMGNLEGILELAAAHNPGGNGIWSGGGFLSWDRFFAWAHINNGELAGYDSARWFPDQFWFWWRATRILDNGAGIHEMPFFSFLLGDLHPHVMAIPFVLLAAGAGLALLRHDGPLDLVVWLERPLWLAVYAIVLGGLAFLNTWDLPTMAFVIALLALLHNRLRAERWSWSLGADTLGFIAPLYLAAFFAYTPFFFGGFDSQASGFTAEDGRGSGLFHSFLIWGPFAIVVLPYAIWRVRASDAPITGRAVALALAPAALVFAMWLLWDAITAVLGWLPGPVQPNDPIEGFGTRLDRGWNWLTAIVMGGAVGLLALALVRETNDAARKGVEHIGHVFALALAATATLLILGTEFVFIQDTFGSRLNTIFKLYYQSWLLLSIASAFALYELSRAVRLPSFDRLPALFGSWSLGELTVAEVTVAGAILGALITPNVLTQMAGVVIGAGIGFAVSATAVLAWRAATGGAAQGALSWRAVWAGSVAVTLLVAFAYPVLATWNRTEGCAGRPLRLLESPPPGGSCGDIYARRSLDAFDRIDPQERAAIEWLNDQADSSDVIAEALGGDYSAGGRISAATGLPTILQWPGHQLQWRGDSEPQTGRPEALEALYASGDADQVRAVLEEFGVRYVYLGRIERETYNVSLPEELFDTAFESEDVIIYRVRPDLGGEVLRE